MTVSENIAHVRARIGEACRAAGRQSDEVTLVAVSKHRTPSAIAEAAAAGITHFGENRVWEMSEKRPDVDTSLTWHMVGHVQRRKARDVVHLFDVVQSVDSVRLARRLSRFAETPLPVLLQMNVSGEAAKYGWEAHNWQNDTALRQTLWDDVREVLALPKLRVVGLMTMAPIVEDMEAVRPVFAGLRRLRSALAEAFTGATWEHLSMGMTDDYPIAIEEGATIVRIGRAIFEVSR